MKKLVIFDLDGTLLNTIADLGSACNVALSTLGYPTHDLQQYQFMVGNGITKLIERALPVQYRDQSVIDCARKHFLEYYGTHCMDLTQPYLGIIELLNQLTGKGIMVAVASNKYQEAVTKLIGHYFPSIKWIAVEGQRDGRPIKPNPAVVDEILTAAGITSRENALYIGDSGVDMDTARNARLESVGVTWGFRPESELREHQAQNIVNHPYEILSITCQ